MDLSRRLTRHRYRIVYNPGSFHRGPQFQCLFHIYGDQFSLRINDDRRVASWLLRVLISSGCHCLLGALATRRIAVRSVRCYFRLARFLSVAFTAFFFTTTGGTIGAPAKPRVILSASAMSRAIARSSCLSVTPAVIPASAGLAVSLLVTMLIDGVMSASDSCSTRSLIGIVA